MPIPDSCKLAPNVIDFYLYCELKYIETYDERYGERKIQFRSVTVLERYFLYTEGYESSILSIPISSG